MQLRNKFGRPLRLGVVGGGPDSWIGQMHRSAAELDGWWRCTAACSRAIPHAPGHGGASLGFDRERSYGTRRRDARAEKARAPTASTPSRS